MALITVCGGCNFSYAAGDGFLNYGALSETAGSAFATFPVNFVLPYDGYISYASVAVSPEPAAAGSTYRVDNLTAVSSVTGLLPVGSGVTSATHTFPAMGGGSLTFTAGEKLIWSAESAFGTTTSTVLTSFCELTAGTQQLLCITASLTGQFNSEATPFSYGAGAHNAGRSELIMKMPINTYLRAAGITANEAGAVLTADADIEVYNGSNLVETFTVTSGTDSMTQVLTTNQAFNRGAQLNLKAGSTVAGLDHAVVNLLFEVR